MREELHKKKRGGGGKGSKTFRGAVWALALLLLTFPVSAASATDLGDITDLSGPRFPSGTLNGAAGAVNYYSFTLLEARDVGLGLRHQETDADLFIEDENGVVLDSSERSGTANEWLRETLLAGSYRVRIEAQEAGLNEYVFRYGVREADADEVARLEGEREDISEGDTDLPDDTTTTGRVAVGGSVTGTIDFSGDEDWFGVEVEEGRTYTVDLEGAASGKGTLSDPMLGWIYDGDGERLSGTVDDDSGEGLNSRVTFTAAEDGTLYIAARTPTLFRTGTYTLTVRDVTPAAAAGGTTAVLVPPPGTNVSGDDTDLPNDNTTTGRVDVGGSVTGTIEIPYDQDRFAVELEGGRTYRFDLQGSPGGGGTLPDTYFRAIYNSEGRYQSGSYNDNFGGSRDSRVTFTPTRSGTYYARVSGDRDEVGSYTLTVTDVTPEEAGPVDEVFVPGESETEPEGAPSHATPGGPGTKANVSEGGTDLPTDTTTTGEVDVGGSVTGTIDPVFDTSTRRQGRFMSTIDTSGDEDWIRATLEAGKRYQIDLEGADTGRGTLEDPYLRIFDADSNEIPNTADDDSGVGNNARTIFTPTASGAHYVSATAGSGGMTDTGTYTVSVIVLGANGNSEADMDFPATIDTTGRVEVGVTGTIDPASDIDWFRVVLEEGRTYVFDLEGSETSSGTLANPRLSIRNQAGTTQYLSDDDSGKGLNSRFAFTAIYGGIHYLVASAASSASSGGTYRLWVRDITLPEDGFWESNADLPTNTTTSGGVMVDGDGARGAIAPPVFVEYNNRPGYDFDTDWFRVVLEAGRTYRIDMKGAILSSSGLNSPGTYVDDELTLRLPQINAIYDEDGGFLFNTFYRDESSSHHLFRVTFTPEDDGTYYIAASGESFEAGGYELRVIDIMDDHPD